MGLKDRFESVKAENDERWRQTFAEGERAQALLDELLISIEERLKSEADFLGSLGLSLHRSARYVHLSSPSKRSLIRIYPNDDKTAWCIATEWSEFSASFDIEECANKIGEILADKRLFGRQP